jgi:hypothetical protein
MAVPLHQNRTQSKPVFPHCSPSQAASHHRTIATLPNSSTSSCHHHKFIHGLCHHRSTTTNHHLHHHKSSPCSPLLNQPFTTCKNQTQTTTQQFNSINHNHNRITDQQHPNLGTHPSTATSCAATQTTVKHPSAPPPPRQHPELP